MKNEVAAWIVSQLLSGKSVRHPSGVSVSPVLGGFDVTDRNGSLVFRSTVQSAAEFAAAVSQ